MYARWADSMAIRTARMREIVQQDARRRAARPTVPARGWLAYAGRYAHPAMGELAIVPRGDSAADLVMGAVITPLEVFGGDTLRMSLPVGRGGTLVAARAGADGRIAAITFSQIMFTRMPTRTEGRVSGPPSKP